MAAAVSTDRRIEDHPRHYTDRYGQAYTKSGLAIPPAWCFLVLFFLLAIVGAGLAFGITHPSHRYDRQNIQGVDCVIYHREPVSCQFPPRTPAP